MSEHPSGVQVGQRVKAVRFAYSPSIDDNITVPPGTEGTVTFIDGGGTAHTKWDNGATLGATVNDQIEVLP